MKKLNAYLRNPKVLAGMAAISAVISFPILGWFFFIFLCPFFLTLLVLNSKNVRDGFKFGFLAGYLMGLGGGYWVAFVLHSFGDLPWPVAIAILLLVCGLEALNIPIFVGVATWLKFKLRIESEPSRWRPWWFVVGLPALFVVFEYLIPKLFPFYLGHAFAKVPLLIQISEITGSLFLSFVITSVGSTAALYYHASTLKNGRYPPAGFAFFPVALIVAMVGFGGYRLLQPAAPSQSIQMALVQANIGSVEKVQSEKGILSKVRIVVDAYERLTEVALRKTPKPELIIWPETAVPIDLSNQAASFVEEVRSKVIQWGVPLVTGGFEFNREHPDYYYNAAFLLNPGPAKTLNIQKYEKHGLLAFGEYMPAGEIFPKLYQLFPQVSHFHRGTRTGEFELNGQSLGITICYEEIVPQLFREIVIPGARAVINLTNDSWFGDTNEPWFHANLNVFRAVENRIPIVRVANTGFSFSVDDRGRMQETTELFKEGILNVKVNLPTSPKITFYAAHGEWFFLCSLLISVLMPTEMYLLNRKRALITGGEKRSKRAA
jgi:apolipoprotein N-acyltransferase